jgi:energy-coupling factor transport system ATP-binding protein
MSEEQISAPPDSDVIIRFEHFTAWYKREHPPVLRDLTLDVRRGECILLLGASGAGKSTLGLCLNGIVPHVLGVTEGELIVAGHRVRDWPVSALGSKVGIIFQDVESQLCMLYVRDEVAFGPENLTVPSAEVERRVRDALQYVGLQGYDNKFVFELSGGQKQKVAIASVLAMRPEILFLDEPTANLDPRSTSEVMDLVRRLRRDHTVIIFENKVDELASVADRLLVLDRGALAFDGPVREVLDAHGEALVNDLGVWIPQVSEIELGLRRSGRVASRVLPLSIGEAVEQYAPLRFSANHAKPPAVAWRSKPVIDVEGVGFRYDDGTVALKDVSFSIRQGEKVAIVGPNGSGKTTISKHFVGLLKPTQGRVVVDGKDTRKSSTRDLSRRIGFVFQNPEHQFVSDTVRAEVAFSLRLLGLDEAEIDRRVEHELSVFNLNGLEDRHPFSLSGGERRRLSVATMIIARPEVLILDEPTYGQDKSNTVRMMQSLFQALAEEDSVAGITLVLVTHDMKLVAGYAERAIVMREGSVAFDGGTDRLFLDPDLLRAANLEYPPLFELSRALRARGANLPQSLLRPEDFVNAVEAVPVGQPGEGR